MDESKLFSADCENRRLNAPSIDDEPHGAWEDEEDELACADWLPEPPPLYSAIKRTMDIFFSLLISVACAPLFLAIVLAIKLTTRGPVIFSEKRLGYRGEPFVLLKFRTMYVNLDRVNHRGYITRLIAGEFGAVGERTMFKVANDPRITRVGRFLRRTSLDGLPQLWNIICGDMSLVGPRPPIACEWAMYSPCHKLGLSCKPGLTGLWQVKGRATTRFYEMEKLDIEYIKHPSILLDLRILLATPMAAIRSDKAF
jgi:lipopolysaccharide/colanic/teichoic acid biosynthesis glycosyltransferase